MNEILLACPSCAAREPTGTATFLILGALVLLPFVLSAIVYRVIRRHVA